MSINIELMIRQGQYMVTAAALTTQLWIQGTAVKPSPALAKMKSHDSQNKVNIPCTIWGDSSYVCDMWVETVRKALSSIWWELEPELSAVIGSVTNGNDCTTLFYLQKERGLCTSRKGDTVGSADVITSDYWWGNGLREGKWFAQCYTAGQVGNWHSQVASYRTNHTPKAFNKCFL